MAVYPLPAHVAAFPRAPEDGWVRFVEAEFALWLVELNAIGSSVFGD